MHAFWLQVRPRPRPVAHGGCNELPPDRPRCGGCQSVSSTQLSAISSSPAFRSPLFASAQLAVCFAELCVESRVPLRFPETGTPFRLPIYPPLSHSFLPSFFLSSPHRLLYAVGGFDGNHRLDSVERYDPERDRWETIASMNQRRSGQGASSSLLPSLLPSLRFGKESVGRSVLVTPDFRPKVA